MFRILICRRSSADEQRHLAARLARRLPRLRGFGLYFELPERAASRVVRKVQRTLSSDPSWRLQPAFFQWTRPNWYAWRSFRVRLSIVLNFFPALFPNRAMKYSTSKGMSAT